MKFDDETFRKCAIIDSLKRKKPKLYEIDPKIVSEILASYPEQTERTSSTEVCMPMLQPNDKWNPRRCTLARS
jgi:hypothetical protein